MKQSFLGPHHELEVSSLIFHYAQHNYNIILMIIMLLLGTFTAKKALPYIPSGIFIKVMRLVLTMIGIKLLSASFF